VVACSGEEWRPLDEVDGSVMIRLVSRGGVRRFGRV
jgi:hypothetical protein